MCIYLFLLLLLLLLLLIGGSTAVGLAAKDYDEKSKDLARCTKEVQKINSEIAALHDLVTNLDCLINQANAAIDATEAMGKAWGSLGTQFNSVIEDFTRAETTEIPSMFVLANLNAGKEDWDDVAKTAHAIQDSLIDLTFDTSAYDRGVLPSATGTPSVTHLTMMQQTVNASVCATGPISSSGDHAQKIADNVNELNSSSMTLDEQTKNSVEVIASVAPTEVVGPLRELKKVIGTIAISRTALTNDLKQLAPLSLEVRQLTVNPVNVKKSREVFAEVSEVLSGIAGGSMKITDDSLRQASSLAMAIDSRVGSWRDDLAKGAKCDKPEIGQLQKDIKSIERKKKDLKKDFWYCVLGAITSTAASTAYVADISKDQDKIDRKSKALSKDNKEYQSAVSIQKLINQLGISADQTAAQSNASLISARALSSELKSISSYPDLLVEAYVQGQAASLATSLAQLGRVSSPASSPMAAPMGLVSIGSFASDQPEEPLLLPLLGTYWESMQLITQAAGVVRAQPTISFNLPASATLLQDQLLAVAHSQDWSFETFYSCLQVLQDFVSTSNLMKSVLPVALKSVLEKNPEYSTQALKIILTKLKQQQVNETNLLTSLKNGFGRDAANDATSFQAASMVMEKLFEGDNGELAQMEAQLNDLRYTMEKNNQQVFFLYFFFFSFSFIFLFLSLLSLLSLLFPSFPYSVFFFFFFFHFPSQIAKGASETVIKLVGTEALCVGLVFGLGAIAIPAATAESGQLNKRRKRKKESHATHSS